MVLLGLGSWIILEYVLHRFLHFGGVEAHWRHHENPTDKSDLFIKWYIVATISLIYCFSFLLLLSATSVMLLYVGFSTGYLLYEWIHYLSHHYRSKNNLLKIIRKHHLKHHYKNKNGNYSVVFPFLDTLLGTKVE